MTPPTLTVIHLHTSPEQERRERELQAAETEAAALQHARDCRPPSGAPTLAELLAEANGCRPQEAKK